MSRRATYVLFFFAVTLFFLTAPTGASAQVIEGRVTDAETQEPLVGATAFVPSLQRGAAADDAGRYRIKVDRPGTYRVVFSFIGYQSETRTAVVADTMELDVVLRPVAIEAAPITITAKAQASDLLSTPQAVVVVEGRALAQERGVTAFEALEEETGVRLLRTGAGIAKPMIRGLTAQRVLVIQNGVRQEGQQWGDEHAPELDAFAVDRIEVVKGPASLLYGSDALGGVIQASSGDLFAYDRPLAGRLGMQALSNPELAAGHLQLGGRSGRTFYEGSVSFKRAGSYETPHRLIPNTGLEERNGALRLGRNLGSGTLLAEYQHFGSEIGLFEPDEFHEGEDIDAFAIEEPYQEVMHDRLRVAANLPFSQHRLELVTTLQQNRRREFGHHGEETDVPGEPEAEHGEDPALFLRLSTLTADARFHHRPVGRLFGTVGLSGFAQRNETLAEEALIPGADVLNGAVYVFEELLLDRLTFDAGLRYDVRRLDVENEEELGVTAQTRTYHAFSGAAGFAWQPRASLSFALNAGRAWRAPVLIELFGSGVHEGTVRFEQGTPTLSPEESLSLDATLRWLNPHLYLEVNGFYNRIQDFIFPQRTSAVDPASGFFVYVYDQAQAQLWGGEFQVDLHPHPIDWVHLRLSGDLTRTRNGDTGDPLPFSPPPRLQAEIALDREEAGFVRDLSLSFGPTYVAAQQRVAPLEEPTDAYLLWSAAASAVWEAGGLTFLPVLAVDNLFDRAYIDPLSRFKPYGVLNPGRTLRFGIQVAIGG